jgi:hypothetical protein
MRYLLGHSLDSGMVDCDDGTVNAVRELTRYAYTSGDVLIE